MLKNLVSFEIGIEAAAINALKLIKSDKSLLSGYGVCELECEAIYSISCITVYCWRNHGSH